MKRASYRFAVAWIAENDEGLERDPEVIASFVSTLLVADLFDVDPAKVGKDVLRERLKNEKASR